MNFEGLNIVLNTYMHELLEIYMNLNKYWNLYQVIRCPSIIFRHMLKGKDTN